MRNFNPLGRKTETSGAGPNLYGHRISIHSVARPRQSPQCEQYSSSSISIHSVARPRQCICVCWPTDRHFNPLGRKTETKEHVFRSLCREYFNPLGRKTETFHNFSCQLPCFISIHSVARPRLILSIIASILSPFQSTRSQDRDSVGFQIGLEFSYFNPLGRKTETSSSRGSSV